MPILFSKKAEKETSSFFKKVIKTITKQIRSIIRARKKEMIPSVLAYLKSDAGKNVSLNPSIEIKIKMPSCLDEISFFIF